jgi:hypothetical protein
MPELPEFLRGRQLVVIDGAVLAEDARAEEVLAALRALGPELDTFAPGAGRQPVPAAHGPLGPTPAVSATATLTDLPEAALEAFPGPHRAGLRVDAAGRGAAPARRGAGAPYCTPRRYLNFAEQPFDVRESFDEERWRQLKGIRSAVDPGWRAPPEPSGAAALRGRPADPLTRADRSSRELGSEPAEKVEKTFGEGVTLASGPR